MVHALRSRRVITPEGERDAAVVIDGERIAAVLRPAELAREIPVEDMGELALLPGLVDVHTHINEPGRTEWEGFHTGSRAAAAGGFTTIVDMPLNCLPETTNVGALEAKRETALGKTHVDYAFWGGAVNGNQSDLTTLARAGVPGFKCFLIYPGCDGFTEIDCANLELAIPHIAESGLPLLVHAELAGPIDAAFAQLERSGADWRRYATWLASRPDDAELDAIALLVELCRTYRFRLHIVHLSTAKALPLLRAAKAEGLPLTVETCPHYLHFAAEDIADGATLFKCAPPIRSRENRELLWDGLLDGTIDLIATDHSPCPPEMKRLTATQVGAEAGRFDEAWGGIPSLSVALSVIWTECCRRNLSLLRLVDWMSTRPATLAGLRGSVGAVTAGRYASLVAFDTEASIAVEADRLHQRHAISPYLGESLRGVVRATWVRGVKVFEHGAFTSEPRGREHAHAGASQNQPMSRVLHRWNEMNYTEAVGEVLPCNGSAAWAEELVKQRPFAMESDILRASDVIWAQLPRPHIEEAFDSHPRLGERKAKAATEQSLRMSAREQSGVSGDDQLNTALIAANRAYEAKFGRIFLLCASGKNTETILNILQRRLGNDGETEFREAAEQQRRITQLRLRRWLGLPAGTCEDV